MADNHVEIIARGILIKNGHLLVCGNRRHGHRFLPGGHVDFGERASDALAREIREEMGIELAVGPFIGATEGRFTQGRSDGKAPKLHHEINLVFALADEAGILAADAPPPCIESHILFQFIDLHDIEGGDVALLPASAGPMALAWAARHADNPAAAAWASDWE